MDNNDIFVAGMKTWFITKGENPIAGFIEVGQTFFKGGEVEFFKDEVKWKLAKSKIEGIFEIIPAEKIEMPDSSDENSQPE